MLKTRRVLLVKWRRDYPGWLRLRGVSVVPVTEIETANLKLTDVRRKKEGVQTYC